MPRAPRRVPWAIAGRLGERAFVAFMLVWLVALVAWPARTMPCRYCSMVTNTSVRPREFKDSPYCLCYHDADLRVLVDALFPAMLPPPRVRGHQGTIG